MNAMAWNIFPDFFRHALESTFTSQPRPGLNPMPGSKPLTIEAVICPVLLYYVALLFLPPPPPQAINSASITALKNALAISAAFLFLRLPLAYHVPQSIGLTYQLGLVGLYGGLRVLDAFYVSWYFWGHIPRRVRYTHQPRAETPCRTSSPRPWSDGGDNSMLSSPMYDEKSGVNVAKDEHKAHDDKLLDVTQPSQHSLRKGVWKSDLLDNMNDESFTKMLDRDASYVELMQRAMDGPKPMPVTETAHTEDALPHGFFDRAAWALELELSMRGVGFTWTTADVRHTRKTWLPTVSNRVHSIFFHVGPVLVIAWSFIKATYVKRLAPMVNNSSPPISPFDELTLPEQYALTAALGAFLMAAFSLGHSIFAIMLAPLAPSPLSFFPPLYTTRVWDVQSVRNFWSFGWHRLFARLFLVWGVWPGEWVERKLTGKSAEQRADVGKVLGGFLSSAFVHSFSVRGVVGGNWSDALGEAKFFALNGVAVIFEEGVRRAVKSWRKSRQQPESQWIDAWICRIWWIGLLLTTGRNFARGWTKAGLVREMAFM